MFDGYFVEGGDVLENKLGITDAKELQDVEYRLSAEKTKDILHRTPSRTPDFDYLLELHGHLFGDLYDFAGKVRRVNISKPDSPVPFAYADFIPSEAARIFGELESRKYLISLEKPEFVEHLATLSADLNALHPFREGNGRTIRLYIDQLCVNAGYVIDFAKVDHSEILQADLAGFAGNLAPLRSLYTKIITKIA